ncbi:MAG: phosphatidate cytidylyltransferase, partial [Clostridium sp.]
VFTERFHAKDGFLCIAYITFFFAIARCFLHIYETNRMYVWFIIIATYACDTAAYFCGRFLGRHKLNVRISPKKTWEGSIGGWFFGAVLSFVFAWFMVDTMTPAQMVLAAAVLTVTGQIGDLAFSAIKRNFGIKDFSDLLPGHGGVLDRVDSLVNFIGDLYLVLMLKKMSAWCQRSITQTRMR